MQTTNIFTSKPTDIHIPIAMTLLDWCSRFGIIINLLLAQPNLCEIIKHLTAMLLTTQSDTQRGALA